MGTSKTLLLPQNNGTGQPEIEKVVERVVHPENSKSGFDSNDFHYSIGEFVATLVDEDESCPFWIGQIKSVIRNEHNIINKLVVHWLDLLGGADVYGGKYKLAKRSTKKKTLA